MPDKLTDSEIVSNNPMDFVECALAIETLAYHNKGFLYYQDNKRISEQIQALLKEAIKRSEVIPNARKRNC